MKVRFISLLLALALVCMAGMPAVVQAQMSQSFVDKVDVTDEVVTFVTNDGDYVDFTMTVAGPEDFLLEQRFDGKETPSLRIKTENGLLPDGSYTIDMRARPQITDKERTALAEARKKGDRYEIRKMMKEIGFNPDAMVFSTYLGVADGQFINPHSKADDTDLDTGAGNDLPGLSPIELMMPVQGQTETRGGPVAYDTATPAVTQTTLGQAQRPVNDPDDLPSVILESDEADAAWQHAFFQNTLEDGISVIFEGYLHVMEQNTRAETYYHAHFRTVAEDGTAIGPWNEGYFMEREDRFVMLDVKAAKANTQDALFDYMTEQDHMAEKLGQTDAHQMDIVHNDDVIARFSLCVGNDCVSGESFGFDTIRMKENNIRIKAQDTSTSASFPTNDWQITFNESSNGGQNKYSIDDIDGGRTPFTIEAGAPSHSLYVDDGGRIGIGQPTPVVELHVVDGNTPTLRLQQDGSNGFTPQTWDVAGNESGFFVRDATNGSKLSFRIEPSTPENALYLENTGDIGIGTNAPDADLHVRNTAASDNADVFLEANGQQWNFRANATTGTLVIRDETGGNAALVINDGVPANLLRMGFTEGTCSGTDCVRIQGDLTIDDQCTEADGACADYVFEPDYEFLTLGELKVFIAENKHLPNVPSTAEIRENGVNVTHMTGRLLEKIEELVLYTLEQQETIEDLQARIQKLETPTKQK